MDPTRIDIITSWVREASKKDTPSTSDLHIDMLSPAYRDPANWISGGCECLAIAVHVLAAEGLDYDLELDFPLAVTSKPGTPDIRSKSDLQDLLGYQPPSLRLLPRDRNISSHRFPATIDVGQVLGREIRGLDVYYTEVVEGEECYRFIMFRLPRGSKQS